MTTLTQHTPRLSVCMTLAAVAFLQACGGGGDEAGSTTNTTPTTTGGSIAGDYYTYAGTTTGTVPAGTMPTTFNTTVAFKTVHGDGSNDRVATYSSSTTSALRTYNAAAAQVSETPQPYGTPSGATCSFAPAAQFVPTFPRSVGQTWSQPSVVRTCGTTTGTLAQSGNVTNLEDVTLPLAVFPSYRTVRNATFTASTGVTVTQETCWYSTTLGANVRCITSSTTTAAGTSTVTSASTTETNLIGYGGPAKAAQGNPLTRFHGNWRVTYTGTVAGSCTGFISAAGALNATCAATGGGTFTATGSVTATGALTVALSSGGTLTGTLSTFAGSGNWAEGTSTGTWVANHL